MCGGSDEAPATPPAATETYAAPDLKGVYQTFRDTGNVPYSYYGQGAPTNADELARVKAAYPGSFTAGAPAAPPPAPQHHGFLYPIIQALRSFGEKHPGNGTMHNIFTGAADGFQNLEDSLPSRRNK